VSKNDRAFLRLQYEHGRSAFYTDPISPVFDADSNQPWWQGQVIETHMFGSSAASQFLVAGTDVSFSYRAKNPSLALSTFPAVLNFFVPSAFTTLGGVDWWAIVGAGHGNPQYQFSEDVVKTWRTHKFGFGANFVRTSWNAVPARVNTIGQLSPQTLDAFYQGGVDPASPSSDFTVLTQAFSSQTSRPFSFFNLALYAQDEWHARSTVTLTLALRAEHYSNPVCQNRCLARLAGPFEAVSHDPNQPYDQAILSNQKQAFEHVDNILWSPRFGFAWQPFGVSHSSVLRGGFGIFYDPLPNGMLDPFSSSTPTYNSYTVSGNNLTPNEKTSLFKDAAASNQAFLNGFAAGQTLAQIQAAIANFFPPAINTAATTMHTPRYQRWSVQWQQAFGADTSLSIGCSIQLQWRGHFVPTSVHALDQRHASG